MAFTDEQIRTFLTNKERYPPSARLMGMELIDFSSQERWAEFAFNPPPSFANPGGNVQGGFICGMLTTRWRSRQRSHRASRWWCRRCRYR